MTNERRIYTAAEARALREGRESVGAWDAGAGNIYAGHDTCPRHRGDAANQRIRCECRAVGAVDGDGDRALAAAAPDLAASVEHYAAENARLRAALADAARGRAFLCEECEGESLATQLDDNGNPLCDEHAAAEVIVDRRDVEHAEAIRLALAAEASK